MQSYMIFFFLNLWYYLWRIKLNKAESNNVHVQVQLGYKCAYSRKG